MRHFLEVQTNESKDVRCPRHDGSPTERKHEPTGREGSMNETTLEIETIERNEREGTTEIEEMVE